MNRARLGLVFAAAATLQAFVLYYLLNRGALMGLVPWDDCAVVLQGLENIEKLQSAQSFLQMLQAARFLDLHSPISALQTLVGLLFSGGAVWPPYAFSFVFVWLAIAAMSRTTALKDGFLFTAVALLVLGQPITFLALGELKADWKAAPFMAAAIFVLFDAAEQDSNRGRLLGAGLLGATLLTKLTGFYNTVPALATFAAFEVYGELRRRQALGGGAPAASVRALVGGLRARAGLYALCVGLILGPYLLFFYYGRFLLIPYMQVALSPVYDLGRPLPQRFAYYAPFSGSGAVVWGALHWMCLVFLLAAMAVAAARRAWLHILACLGVLGLAALFLAPLLIAHTLNSGFGAAFYGVMIGAALVAMRILALHAPRPVAMATPLVVLVLTLFSGVPLTPPRGEPIGRVLAAQYQRHFDSMADTIVATAATESPRVVFLYEHVRLPYPDLSILYYQRTSHFLQLERIDDLADRLTAPIIDRSEFAVTLVPEGASKDVPDIDTYPISADLAAGDARIRATGRFHLVRTYPVRGGEIRLYQAPPQPPAPAA